MERVEEREDWKEDQRIEMEVRRVERDWKSPEPKMSKWKGASVERVVSYVERR